MVRITPLSWDFIPNPGTLLQILGLYSNTLGLYSTTLKTCHPSLVQGLPLDGVRGRIGGTRELFHHWARTANFQNGVKYVLFCE